MIGDALRSLHEGGREREQTVFTPDLILDPLRSVWGGILFDPCAGPDGLVWVECTLCKGTGRTKAGKACTPGSLQRSSVNATHSIREPDDGLRYVWIDRTFVNPPFGTLEEWLAPQTAGLARVEWLVPVRPHRRWWRAWARTCDALIFLNPFAFKGHAQTFPAPLCAGYRGHDAAQIVEAYRELGEPL